MLSDFQHKQKTQELRNLRMLTLITAIVVTALGFLFEELYNDGWILLTGLILSMSMIVGFLASYYSAVVRRYFSRISDIVIFLIHTWIVFVAYQRDFDPVVLLPAAISIITFSLIFDNFRRSLLFIFSITTLMLMLMVIRGNWRPEDFVTLISLYAGASISYLLQQRKERFHEEIATQETRFAALVENMNDGLIFINEHWRIRMVSDQFCRISGYSRGELLGSDLRKLTADNEAQRNAYRFFKALEEGKAVREEFQLLHKTEGLIYVRANGAPYFREQGGRTGSTVVYTDISFLKETERELREAYNELDTFFYKASHDLRGPLASMMGVVSVGKNESKNLEITRYFEMVETSVHRLDGTLKELIELARTRKGASKLGAVKIKELVNQVLTSLSTLPRYAKISFAKQLPDTLSVYTDKLLLQSVLHNLLQNAVNYSDRDQPVITIIARESGPSVELMISDNGTGIPESVRPRIFEMFYRGHLDSSGPGLGLFIVKNALEKMNGTIRFECPEGKGTTFYVTLPKQFIGD